MELLVTQIDEIHDNKGNLLGYQCFDGTGQSVKVKKGQGGALKDKWPELQVGRAYSFTMGSFTPPGKDTAYPYVKDFQAMSEALAEKIPEEPSLVTEAKNLGAVEDTKMTKGDWADKETRTRASIERQTALNNATSIAVAKIGKGVEMNTEKTIEVAKSFAKYLDTGA